MTLDRRTLLTGLLVGTGAFAHVPSTARAVGAAAGPVCGLDLHGAAFRSARDWDVAYEVRWGKLGPQPKSRLDAILHNKGGVYDDRPGHLAWIGHYWIRAYVAMAHLTGDPKYMQAALSFVEYMLAHTDERRVQRGEIVEDYVRDPLYLRGTGKGGPFWKRGDSAICLNTGQIAHGIMIFADAVLRDPSRWPGFLPAARRAFREAKKAVDAFDNDWQVTGRTGSYHYRDSQGSGQLGVARAAFNQSATMMVAQLLIQGLEPSPCRVDKIARLARYWMEDFANVQSDGSVTWRYIINPSFPQIEDTGHASLDVDFLTRAYLSGLTDLDSSHMDALARTFLTRVYNGRDGLNRYVDGRTDTGFKEHWNAAIGWLELARVNPTVAKAALTVYNAKYPPDAPGGVLWARPMLGWASLLRAGAC